MGRLRNPIGKKTLAVLVMLIVFTSALVVLGATVPKVKNLVAFKTHEAIVIAGDDALDTANGIVGGAGTAMDPYIIENWSLATGADAALEINDTRDFIVVRNCTIIQSSHGFGLKNGISIHGAQNIEIENVSIQGFATGISIEGSRSAHCENISVRSCALTSCKVGVLAQNVSRLLVEHSILGYIELSGTVALNCTSVDIVDNTISVWHYYWSTSLQGWHFLTAGIGVADSDDVSLRWNDVSVGNEPISNIATSRCHNLSVEGNCLSGSGVVASVTACTHVSVCNNSIRVGVEMLVERSDDCLVADNVITDVRSSGIGVIFSSNVTLVRNSVLYCYDGISAIGMNDSLIEGNLLANCTQSGLSVHGRNLQIARNLIVYDFGGAVLSGWNITFEWNIVMSNLGVLWGSPHGGLRCVGSNTMAIRNNSFSMNRPGLEISTCANVLLEHNNISDNITLWDDNSLAIWGNSMHNVSIPTDSPFGVVSFDQGYPVGGNYWSQYTGADLKSGQNQNMPGADGFGDTPYQINATIVDDYPLMSPPDSSDTGPPLTEARVAGYLAEHSWFSTAVNVTLEASDVHTGVALTSYRIDGSAWTAYSTAVRIASQGIHTFEFYSVDGAGNVEETRSITIKIDTEPPFSTALAISVLKLTNTKNTTLEFEFADNTSGIIMYEFQSEWTYYYSGLSVATTPVAQGTLRNGNNSFYLSVQDEAGHWSSRVVVIQDSLNENKQLLSTKGPFGPWYVVTILADLILLSYLVHLRAVEVYGPAVRRQRRMEPGEVDKEDVIDGYSKYLKRL